ncbi:peptidase S8/S53 domain-containing protein [Trichoderma barbatum]
MKHTLDVYRSANDLAFSQLPPPDLNKPAPSSTLDEEAIKKENALEFYRFEIAFPQVSGAQVQLETFAAIQENLAEEGQQADRQEDPHWTEIQDGVRNEVTQFGSRIQAVQTTVVSEQEAIDDHMAKATQYVDSIVKTGVADDTVQDSLLPRTVSELIVEVARKTGLNKLIGQWLYRMFSPLYAESTADSEGLPQAVRADALYKHLAAQHCREKVHSALLQLSGWGDSPEGESVFRMFLSGCSGGGWHRAICTFESREQENSRPNKLSICDKFPGVRSRKVPLLLSFNHNQLWKSSSNYTRSILPKDEIERFNLKTLLAEGQLKKPDLDTSVRKFRLALRLASSLYSLHFGPWIQEDWSPYSVEIIRDRDVDLLQLLDEAYVLCNFTADWVQKRIPPTASPTSSEICPRFFLSLAQLLVDVANGENTNQGRSAPEDLDSWYKALADEVRKNKNNQLMADYWTAIEGCLLYQEYYESPGHQMNDEDNEKKRMWGQEIISRHIICHLQKHLNFWNEQQKVQSIHNAKNKSITSQPHVRVEAKFTLWSKCDADWEKIDPPTTEPSESSFITHMKRFRDTYIEGLDEPKKTEDGDDSVCVAIIDTGFLNEEMDSDSEENHLEDSFLAHPDVRSRVRKKQNFFSPTAAEPDPNDYEDKHGHGTQVARLVLKFAPRATVIIAKISDSETLRATKTAQLVKALEWAGKNADIINLSFSLGSTAEPGVERVIKNLISNNKLIFAAASNTGGYGSRLWPAKQPGVFAIHAANEFGTVDPDMNPQPLTNTDNFSTLGCKVNSYWGGHHRSISGTSFATPVAAATAANILEYARRTQPENVVKGLTRYSAMRTLFRNYMTLNKVEGAYHSFHPWAEGLWDGKTKREDIARVLWNVSI